MNDEKPKRKKVKRKRKAQPLRNPYRLLQKAFTLFYLYIIYYVVVTQFIHPLLIRLSGI